MQQGKTRNCNNKNALSGLEYKTVRGDYEQNCTEVLKIEKKDYDLLPLTENVIPVFEKKNADFLKMYAFSLIN